MSRLSTFAASAVPPPSKIPKLANSNLFNHVMKRHPDYLSTMKMSGFNSGTLVTFIDQKSQTIYSWLILITEYIFDELIEKHPVVGTYLSADAAIVKDPDFESACVLALSGRIEGFTGDQQLMLHPFETTPQAVIPDSTTGLPRALRQSIGGQKEAKNSEED
ncbi:hypothetical protein GQ600_15614 [Phytophthora cactorum]|nr:hypothetical protein GQ600_15614 [Phytophthora cactorum]